MADIKKTTEIGKKIADTSKKQAHEVRMLKTQVDILRSKPDSKIRQHDVKCAGDRLKKTTKELGRLQSEFKKYS